LIDKRTQYQLVEQLGVPMPRTYHGTTSSTVRSRELEFPLVIKPAISAQWPLGRQKAILVDDALDLERHLREMEQAGVGVVLQSAIPGPASRLYTVVAYVSQAGEPLAWGTYRKVRQYPADFGMGAVTEAVSVPALEDRALHLLRDIRFTGTCGIEFKQDPRDGVFRFIEINPRFELSNSLVAAAGADLTRAMYADLIGCAQPPRRAYRAGISWMALNLEWKACRELAARGEFSWKNWAVSLRGLRREALFTWDDPLPGLASYLNTFRNALREYLRSGFAQFLSRLTPKTGKQDDSVVSN
jgi:predicted ATP-grasp superfamily ATP-dependent carboligase